MWGLLFIFRHTRFRLPIFHSCLDLSWLSKVYLSLWLSAFSLFFSPLVLSCQSLYIKCLCFLHFGSFTTSSWQEMFEKVFFKSTKPNYFYFSAFFVNLNSTFIYLWFINYKNITLADWSFYFLKEYHVGHQWGKTKSIFFNFWN